MSRAASFYRYILYTDNQSLVCYLLQKYTLFYKKLEGRKPPKFKNMLRLKEYAEAKAIGDTLGILVLHTVFSGHNSLLSCKNMSYALSTSRDGYWA